MTNANTRVLRLNEFMDNFEKRGSFDKDELDQIVDEAKELYTDNCARLVEMLVRQIKNLT